MDTALFSSSGIFDFNTIALNYVLYKPINWSDVALINILLLGERI